MAEKRVHRRLAAIMAADVVGYSRLIRADEEGTRARFNAIFNDLVEPLVANFRGRVVKMTGDGFLAEFGSVVDAVQCSIEFQQAIPKRNSGAAPDSLMAFRIGVNLGDVIVEGDDIHGDGVNVAARLEGNADSGGICISANAFDQVRDRLDVGFRNLGEQDLKNIDRPVHAYSILLDGALAGQILGPALQPKSRVKPVVIVCLLILIVGAGGIAWWQPWTNGGDTASIENMRFPLPDRPSVAVLPFTNMSDDRDQEYFADGITEDIITDLSKVSGLFVIARNSTFTYKGQAVNVRQVAEELGVRYVLEGSVRRAGDRLRITAQLIDAVQGDHLWAERYDRQLTDVFDVQSDVAQRVVRAMAVTLKANEQERLFRTHTTNIDAYDLFLQARKTQVVPNNENLVRARQLYERVIVLDPEFGGGYAGLSFIHSLKVRLGLSTAPAMDVKRALELANKAISIDEELGWSYIALGSAHVVARQPDAAVAATRRALEIQPNDADAHIFMGYYSTFAGNPSVGVESILTSMRLDPKLTIRQVFFLGMAHFMNGDLPQAIAMLEKYHAVESATILPMAFLAASYAEMGEEEKAADISRQVLEIEPEFSLSNWQFIRLFKTREDRDRVLNALRVAGLPE